MLPGIVGRREEIEVLHACLAAGRHVLLEGPVGVGKTALAHATCTAPPAVRPYGRSAVASTP